MIPESTCLQVGAWMPRSVVNGPGERFVLWLQGCSLRCPGCFNEEFWPPQGGSKTSVEKVARLILATPGIEGVTYTGGEPMAQAHGLALLTRELRAAGLTFVCYTGYTLEALRACRDLWIERLLSRLDILIDGPYRREEAALLPWRGSRNQRVHFLSDRYQGMANRADGGGAQMELTLGAEGYTATGAWPEGLLERLRALLEGGRD